MAVTAAQQEALREIVGSLDALDKAKIARVLWDSIAGIVEDDARELLCKYMGARVVWGRMNPWPVVHNPDGSVQFQRPIRPDVQRSRLAFANSLRERLSEVAEAIRVEEAPPPAPPEPPEPLPEPEDLSNDPEYQRWILSEATRTSEALDAQAAALESQARELTAKARQMREAATLPPPASEWEIDTLRKIENETPTDSEAPEALEGSNP